MVRSVGGGYRGGKSRTMRVHFAGAEVINQSIALKSLGIKNTLYTAFPFLERKVLGTALSPIMPCHLSENPYKQIPEWILKYSDYCIQDSGLFTLMFGARQGKIDYKVMSAWYDGLVEFTLNNSKDIICVEVDCQKVLGVDAAWEFRKRLANDIPNRIINVFHIEDGRKGLDRLIEYSDYIALSVPELRRARKRRYLLDVAHYIKNKKPEIDIHLLGFTELSSMRSLNFCTSCDSTSYTAAKRFGWFFGNHISNIRTDAVKKLVGDETYARVREWNSEQNTNALLLNVYYFKNRYAAESHRSN